MLTVCHHLNPQITEDLASAESRIRGDDRGRIRWPDGARQRCLSPSRTIERALTAGAAYPVAEFVRRSVWALEAGSERLREVRGFACTAAAAQADAIVARSEGQEGHVVVEQIQRAPARKRFPAPDQVSGHVPVVIVGGGQAGLALSTCSAGGASSTSCSSATASPPPGASSAGTPSAW